MTLQRTGAFSSRISKPPAFRRTSSSSSPFATARRSKSTSSAPPRKPSLPLRKSSSRTEGYDDEDVFTGQLEDHGLLTSMATDHRFSDVVQLLQYILSRMFAPIPDSASGMNSVRIAEVLNYRLRLPPIVSIAHVHSLSLSPTRVEKEVSELAAKGVVRKLLFAGRGEGAEAIGEGLVLVEEWQKLVRASESVSVGAKDKYCDALARPSVSPDFTAAEVAELLAAGYLTRATGRASKADTYLQLSTSSTGTLSSVLSAGSDFISGSLEAAAEGLKDNMNGGQGAADRFQGIDRRKSIKPSEQFTLSLPNTGPYLKLLHDAKTHLASLLSKGSKFKELPQTSLFEKWDGGVAGTDDATRAARARGEFRGILPGKTRKWKQFYGLESQWVLEECLGAGLVECFKTGSVGVGVRLI